MTMIQADGLTRSFTGRQGDRGGGPWAGPPRRRRRARRLPRAERGRQVDQPADADDAARADRRQRHGRRFDVRTEPQRVRERIGYVGQGHGAADDQRVRDELVTQGRAYGLGGRRRPARRADALLDSLELDSARQADGEHAVRRSATASRRRHRDGPPAAPAVPRRAVHGPRSAEPRQPVGPPRPAARGARDDDLPDHPLSRRGRRHGRTRPRHRCGSGHRRWHARSAQDPHGRRPRHPRRERTGAGRPGGASRRGRDGVDRGRDRRIGRPPAHGPRRGRDARRSCAPSTAPASS